MTDLPHPLTAANIRYLLVIRELDPQQQGARSVDIAQRLGVSKPSVTTMTRSLVKLGLVEKERYSAVFLTGSGRRMAEAYAVCCALLLRHLARSLGFPNADYRDAACLLLAETPAELLPELHRKLAQAQPPAAVRK